MMRNKILILILIVPLICQGQRSFTKMNLSSVSQGFHNELEVYAGKFGHVLKRSAFLDSCAFQRANYFLSVLETTAKTEKMSLWGCGEFLPHATCKKEFHNSSCKSQAEISHDELFGRPDFFSRPSLVYPEVFLDFPEKRLQIESEIMIPTRWEKTFTKKQDLQEIVLMAMGTFSKKTGTFSGDLLECYKSSDSHNEAIIEDGKGEFGIVTLALIEKVKISENKWRYGVVIYNLVIFTSPMKSL